MADAVLDASAVLASLHGEPGAETVESLFDGAMMTAVNHAEVLTHLIENGLPLHEARHLTDHLGYRIVAADAGMAVTAADLAQRARRKGISLGDRFCLALAKESNLPVVTADRRWAELDLGVEVRLIR